MNVSSDERKNTHVIVGLSGGVDSSVAALQLVNQGFQVSGVFMQNWEDDDEQCTARQDYRDAAAVANKLNIPISTVNFAEDYWDRVFAHFLDEYSAGRTPNPDILCNKEIKFKAFLDYAVDQGADLIATGHYARVGYQQNCPTLMRGRDPNKDQSYFLYTLKQEQLRRTLFPVGNLLKDDVRAMAKDAGFHLHAKKDSTGICFIGERKFRDFLAQYLPAQPGNILSDTSQRLGTHNGLMFYTLGQRQGLGIGGQSDSREDAWYVLDKNLMDNTLIVGQGHDHPSLLRQSLQAHEEDWIAGHPPAQSFSCTAKVRYRQQDVPVSVSFSPEHDASASADNLTATFNTPVRAVTPGQSIVFYEQQVCLGGAVIGDFPPIMTAS